MFDRGRKTVNQLHRLVVRPSLVYENEMWGSNKSQAAALESVVLGGGKLWCSSKTFNEAVRGI